MINLRRSHKGNPDIQLPGLAREWQRIPRSHDYQINESRVESQQASNLLEERVVSPLWAISPLSPSAKESRWPLELVDFPTEPDRWKNESAFASPQWTGVTQEWETRQELFRRLARERRLKKINQEIHQWYESLSPEVRQKFDAIADEYLAMTEEQRDQLWDELDEKAYAELEDKEEIELTSEFVPARQRRD